MSGRPLAIAGATGHVGSALLDRFAADGRRVRCLVRDASKLREGPTIEPVEGDLTERETLDGLFTEGCIAYFLVHALDAGGSLAEGERAVAENFADAARAGGASRIVYLGGLVDEEESNLSPHMRSRLEVGRILRDSGVQTIEFRASIVIGAGSFSFELIRRLVDNVPLIALPGWADNLAQPIALADVVEYLAAAADAEIEGSTVVEIGGGEQISYRKLIQAYADAVGARRGVVSVPAPDIAMRAASRAARPLTGALPGEALEALQLFDSLRHSTIVHDRSADAFDVEPMRVHAAIDAALADAA